MPSPRPTNKTAPSGSLRESACATAIAGNRCPPVPPPEINTRMPDPAHLFALDGDVHEYPQRKQGDREGRTTIAYEGQRDPGRGKRNRHSGDVDKCLERDPGCDPASNQRTE